MAGYGCCSLLYIKSLVKYMKLDARVVIVTQPSKVELAEHGFPFTAGCAERASRRICYKCD